MMSDVETIAQLLLEHWDPLGVAGVDAEPEREYTFESALVLEALRRGAGEREIALSLADARLSSSPHQDSVAAEAIARWWRQH